MSRQKPAADMMWTEEVTAINQAVKGFARVMKSKLIEKAAKGYHGWRDREYNAVIRTKMLEHAARLYAFGEDDQAVDVANFAMMLFFQNKR